MYPDSLSQIARIQVLPSPSYGQRKVFAGAGRAGLINLDLVMSLRGKKIMFAANLDTFSGAHQILVNLEID